MENSAEEKVFDRYWMEDTIDFVNKIAEKRQIEQDKKIYNERMKYLSSIIYKISLYNLSSLSRPNWLIDEHFDEIFKFSKNIYATVIDGEHIQEIKTGMVFPIVDLEKKDDNWKSSNIIYGDLDDNNSQFAISYSKVLKTEKGSLKELYNYLKYDKEVIENYINGEQGKTKSMVKNNKSI